MDPWSMGKMLAVAYLMAGSHRRMRMSVAVWRKHPVSAREMDGSPQMGVPNLPSLHFQPSDVAAVDGDDGGWVPTAGLLVQTLTSTLAQSTAAARKVEEGGSLTL
jgi:hypothetical protein